MAKRAKTTLTRRPAFRIGKKTVRRGETRDIYLPISQRYTGDDIHLPVRVIRAMKPGPTLLVSAVVHGNELNGMGIVHELIYGSPLELAAGTLVLVPVLNVFGVETLDRYMPDRRDLNRCFPGALNGSLTTRVAHIIFENIIRQCDYAVDLHTAAVSRTNFPNVRGDLRNSECRRLARAFGCELIVSSTGQKGTLRREATAAGCPTIILEAGEPAKIEPGVMEIGVRGVRNVLTELGMLAGEVHRPAYQVEITRSAWVRAQVGGILRFHIAPGEMVLEGQPIATNASMFGKEQNIITSSANGIVLGMTTLPTVKPGEPVCHIAVPGSRAFERARKALNRPTHGGLHHRLRKDLATNISVTEPEGDWADTAVKDDD